MYLKRYRGETNCQVNVLLDTSGSMRFGSKGMEKLDYAKTPGGFRAVPGAPAKGRAAG